MTTLVIYALLSAFLVGLYRWLALRFRWLDAPNQRSSHTTITPRGAGIVFALLILCSALWSLHLQRAYWFAFLPCLLVALTGWWDDLRGLSARARFVVYGACAAATVALILTIAGDSQPQGFAIVASLLYGAAAALGLLWLINLYNFMDGINGIAAIEALFVLSVTGALAHTTPYALAFIPLHWLACAVLAGFLLWNFPLGKVFMGDAGSAFLGCFLGALMLWSDKLSGPSITVWLILLGVFVVDSSYTLLIRITTGQHWSSAHRLHAYQRFTDRLGNRHARTIIAVMTINVGWLLPMAWLVHSEQVNALVGLGLAYAPLFAACYWLKAGIPTRGAV